VKFIVLLFTSLGTCTAYGSQTNVHHAMQETKMDFEYPDTESIEIQLHHHDINSKDLIAKNYTLNLNIKKDTSNNLASNEDVRTMVSEILNRKAESLKIVQLQDVKKYFRTPKPTTAQKIITLFAYETPNAQT